MPVTAMTLWGLLVLIVILMIVWILLKRSEARQNGPDLDDVLDLADEDNRKPGARL